ncbi:b(0,+)-type amino acid transporter 1-like isoform X1 [Haliotis cracherodii]|uniref:b(0,+)-type amino acid transporter 1-like isoform X1 n=1 Tax=Haliotis cracherodii TaxID=6455 RepID=UPI0039EB0D0D
MANGKGPDDAPKMEMKRNIGLLSGIGLIVGTMIGSGIFISPKGVLEGCGSVGLSLIIWTMCGVLATMGALVYAELGTAVPRSGGEHAYLMYTYKGEKSRIGKLPAFLFDWTGLFIIRPTMVAVISLAMGTYIVKPFYTGCDPPTSVIKLVTALGMLLITFCNCYSVRLATIIQNTMTVLKLIAIAIITVGGLYKLAAGNTEYISEGFEGTSQNPSTVIFAFYNGLWAFDGWNSLNFVTEELENPSRNLPIAIMVGIPVTTLCYVLANIGYFSVMSKEEIILSHAVAVTWGDRVLGVMSWCIPMFVAMSTFGSVNGSLFSSGRLCYVAGRDSHFPKMLSFIHHKRLTPIPAMLFTLTISILLLIPGDISTLIDCFSFASWLVYGVTSLSLIVLRFTEKDLHRPYKVPIIVPVIVFLASCYLVLAPILQNPGMQFLYAIIFIGSGVFIFVPFVYMRIHFRFMDRLTELCQKVLLLLPTTQEQATK